MTTTEHREPPLTRERTDFDEAAFLAVLREAREGAAGRDRARELPRDLISRAAAAGLGRARVPVADGGEGADLVTLVDRLIRLAAADPNVAHVFRGHLAFVERLRLDPRADARERWFPRVVAGDLVGNAQSERTGTTDLATTLTRTASGLRLDGRKYYTTGTLYADWIDLSARLDDADHQVFVSTRAPGVTVVDDWNGFGQRLTGSGTTVFDAVPVAASDVRRYGDDDESTHAYLMGFFQLMLLAVVAGIARGAVDDAVAFVRGRSRTFGVPGITSPAEDPQVQSVVGDLSAAAFTARATVLAAAAALDAALLDREAGGDDPAAFVAAQVDVYRAQHSVLPLVIEATGSLFEVGGASAVDADLALDRHWRNARTVATHNPAHRRTRAVGEYELLGNPPAWPGRDRPAPREAPAR